MFEETNDVNTQEDHSGTNSSMEQNDQNTNGTSQASESVETLKTQKVSESVPYDRFSEVNSKYREAEEKLKLYEEELSSYRQFEKILEERPDVVDGLKNLLTPKQQQELKDSMETGEEISPALQRKLADMNEKLKRFENLESQFHQKEFDASVKNIDSYFNEATQGLNQKEVEFIQNKLLIDLSSKYGSGQKALMMATRDEIKSAVDKHKAFFEDYRKEILSSHLKSKPTSPQSANGEIHMGKDKKSLSEDEISGAAVEYLKRSGMTF